MGIFLPSLAGLGVFGYPSPRVATRGYAMACLRHSGTGRVCICRFTSFPPIRASTGQFPADRGDMDGEISLAVLVLKNICADLPFKMDEFMIILALMGPVAWDVAAPSALRK